MTIGNSGEAVMTIGNSGEHALWEFRRNRRGPPFFTKPYENINVACPPSNVRML